jgi:hypothetical protein
VSSGASLIFTNWTTSLTAADVNVRAGGTITCSGPFADTAGLSNRVWIICTNLLVETNGTIHASGRGFSSYNGPGKGLYNVSGENGGAGAGHGGYGGQGSSGYAQGGGVYGSAQFPGIPGSGGGNAASGQTGGAGGGAIWIEAAREVTIHGTISATGNSTSGGATYSAGAGSGGAIYIGCETIRGSANGLVSVDGGSALYQAGLGAGGRIGVSYNTTAQQQAGNPGVRFSARPGTGAGSTAFQAPPGYGRPALGTLWLPDALLISTNWAQVANTAIVNPTSWSVSSMDFTGIAVGIQGGGLITVSNDIVIGNGGSLYLIEGSSLNGLGSLTLTNGGQLYVYAGATNAAVGTGAVVSISGVVSLSAGSWIYPFSNPTNGGSPFFRVGRLLVATNAGFDAGGRGFGAVYHMGDGYGPGKGQGGSPATIGAGYGGAGKNANATYGKTYGSSNAPIHPGSGGGSDFAGFGGRGGGLIRIETEQDIQLAGTLSANSPTPDIGQGSGGSGGGIFVLCNEFLGDTTSLMTVNGGSRGSTGSTAGGGGGRIAVGIGLTDLQRATMIAGNIPEKTQIQNTYDRFDGQVTAKGGTYTNSPSGADGTAVWIWRERATGSIFTIR